MKTSIFIFILIMGVLWGAFPLFGADSPAGKDIRNTPVTVNLIIDGSAALSGARDEMSAWVTKGLIDGLLQNGDRITIWSAGGTAQVLYSETVKNENDRENIKNTLKNLPARGDTADFSGALRDAASRSGGNGIYYTLLICASPAALSPTLLGAGANLMRFSRIEEFRGWRAMVVSLGIDSRVRQAAAAYLSGV